MKEININNAKRSYLIFEISKVVDSDDDATLIVDYLEKAGKTGESFHRMNFLIEEKFPQLHQMKPTLV